MRKSFIILIVLFVAISSLMGISNWYYHDVVLAPPELALFHNTNDFIRNSDWMGVIFMFGVIPDLLQVLMVNSISSIPTYDKLSDEQVISHSKTIPEVQAFLAKYPDAPSYVDRSGSFLLRYTVQEQYKPDHWNHDDSLSLGLLMYADGNPYKITISCHQDTMKTTSRVLEYLEVETCLRQPIPAKEKSDVMPLCNPSDSVIPSSTKPNSDNTALAEWQETGRYYMYQRFADELHHRGITMAPGCMDVKTELPEKYDDIHLPYFTMCSIVNTTDDEKYYLEGTIDKFDVVYFYMSNQMHYPCDGDDIGCLCQFDK